MASFDLGGNSANPVYTTTVPGAAAPVGPTAANKAEDTAHVTGDVGHAVWGVRNDNTNINFTDANIDYSPIAVDASGSQFYRTKPAGTATLAGITVGTASGPALAANPARRGATIVNNSGQIVYLRYGGTAVTTTLYSWSLAVGEKYEIPFGITAQITCIASTAGTAGGLLVGEYTD